MKVLLTGASGFVGSHVLDCLRSRGVATAILLRPSSDRAFLAPHLNAVEIRAGSINDPASLREAMRDATHVIHCAGCTKAIRVSEFYDINHAGTRQVVEAVNAQEGRIQRLVHISSLAAIGPGTREHPARESDTPHPVSEYGRSKLAGENEVRERCRAQWTIVRPPAVYGPRDAGFLSLFEAVNRHLLPRTNPRQALSLVYVEDLVQGIVRCLDHPAAAGKSYFIAQRQIVTGREMAEEIARQIGHWTMPLPLPTPLFWPVCLLAQLASRVTGKAGVLSLQKYAELRAPGWVCDPSLGERELRWRCETLLDCGIQRTLEWYRKNGRL